MRGHRAHALCCFTGQGDPGPEACVQEGVLCCSEANQFEEYVLAVMTSSACPEAAEASWDGWSVLSPMGVGD